MAAGFLDRAGVARYRVFMRAVVPLCLLLTLVGCVVAPILTAGDLASRARTDLLGAQRDLAGREVVVRGAVQQTTLTPRETIEVTQTLRPSFYPTATGQTVREQVPLVVLEPGTVLCYFEPYYITEASAARAGDQVSFRCRVDSFRADANGHVAILGDCRRQQ